MALAFFFTWFEVEIVLKENITTPEEKFIARIILFYQKCNDTVDQ